MINRIYNVLSIAGTDPSGGAGIQADLKTFSALGVYGATVITAIVAQNTQGVQFVYPLTSQCLIMQLNSVLSDVKIDSVKIGMLYQKNIIHVVAEKLIEFSIPWIVLDPVMMAKNGSILLEKDAVVLIREKLLPLVSLLTPNLPEAAILLGCDIAKNENQMCQQGRKLLELGCKAIVMKGGHLPGKSTPDWLITADKEYRFSSPRVHTLNTHGTGCTLSAALAAKRPYYEDWAQTLKFSKKWLYQALINSNNLTVGKGIGPIHHFYEWW